MLGIIVNCDKCGAETALCFDTENDSCADAKTFLRSHGWSFTNEVGSGCKVSCPACTTVLTKQPPLTREYLLSVVDDLWNKQQKLAENPYEPYESLKRHYLLRLLYREILMRCVVRLRGAVVRHQCLTCPVVQQINAELYAAGYSIRYELAEHYASYKLQYWLLSRDTGEHLATVYGK